MPISKRMGSLALILCLLTGGCAHRRDTAPLSSSPPAPPSETPAMRAVWVSYLELDPMLNGATKEEAAASIEQMMERCEQSGVNTVFFHVRAHSDAYYDSSVFPAADSAKALLSDGFDPLKAAVEAAHRHRLALHAWINPYRIGDTRTGAVNNDVFQHDGSWYYIPSSAKAQQIILQGVREIVDRYAVDGVQYDDYFYPAGLGDQPQSFEQVTGTLSVAEWRRAAVSALIAATFCAVHSRDDCVFGVSPSGQVDRCTNAQYADVARWLKYPGYVDYLCPQLYSGFNHETLPFVKQMQAFAALPRADGVKLYAGLALYKAGQADAYAGTGSEEWQHGGDILSRQAQMAEQAGYHGVALFRFAFWDINSTEKTVPAAEKRALTAYFDN